MKADTSGRADDATAVSARRSSSRRRLLRRLPVVCGPAALVVLALILAACGSSGSSPQPTATVTVTAPPTTASPSATPSVAPSPSGTTTTTLSVYFMRPIGGSQPDHGPFIATAHRTLPATSTPATAAVKALLTGPSVREHSIGMATVIPAGTRLLGLTISGGVATVDLSGAFASGGGSLSMTGRLAQVVYTLTQFPSVTKGVVFKVDGKPVTVFGGEGIVLTKPQKRRDYESLTPPIFVETPAPFDAASGKLVLKGTANVFEATFQAKLVSATGRAISNLTVTATSGSGTRGTFQVNLPISTTATQGRLVVWDASAENGSPLHTVRIPLTFVSPD